MEKVILKLQNGWIWTVQRCGKSWRSSRRPETPLTDQGVEENGASAPLNSGCMVDLLTPAAAAKVLQLRRGLRRSFSLVFLRSWGELTLRFGRSRVFPVSWNFFTRFHTVKRFISIRFAIATLLFLLLWSSITAFRSIAIVKLIFDNIGIPCLKVEIVSF